MTDFNSKPTAEVPSFIHEMNNKARVRKDQLDTTHPEEKRFSYYLNSATMFRDAADLAASQGTTFSDMEAYAKSLDYRVEGATEVHDTILDQIAWARLS